MKKWLVAAVYVLAMGTVFMYRTTILDWLGQDGHMPLSLLVATGLALFPIVPYKAVIGLFGYVYGSLAGGMLCWLATTAAAALMFGAVKWLFPERASRYLETVRGLDTFTSAVRRHPFAAVAVARLLPIVPQMAVNVYAAAAGLPFRSFMLATGLGKIPGIALFAYLGGNAWRQPGAAALATALYVAALLAILAALRAAKMQNNEEA